MAKPNDRALLVFAPDGAGGAEVVTVPVASIELGGMREVVGIVGIGFVPELFGDGDVAGDKVVEESSGEAKMFTAGATVTGATSTGATVTGASSAGAKVTGASSTGAKVTGASSAGAKVTGGSLVVGEFVK
jgi:hypothetical protein